ncbi:hypothetical protein ACFV98_34920 [Streptomyces violascens]|uniref:hypothetical protein n=1 Tax=Streptomyces violascens TaxID=67381 RepID=UPI00365D185D
MAGDITTPRPVFVFTSAAEACEGTAAVPVPGAGKLVKALARVILADVQFSASLNRSGQR